MTLFEDVLSSLRAGKVARRESWGTSKYIKLSSAMKPDPHDIIVVVTADGYTTWRASSSDLLAEDWKIRKRMRIG